MSSNRPAQVLAIGIDAAEPTLVRELIEAGEMPVLKSLLACGKWLRVKSPAHIGSGSVWPTFITGEEPASHGVYGEWCWRPKAMNLERYGGSGLNPFWQSLAENGVKVGILDIPFAPLVGLKEGFEVSEWGPHDLLKGQLEFSPPEIAGIMTNQTEPHPLASDRLDADGPNDYERLQKLSAGCLEGVKRRGSLAEKLIDFARPRLALINFPEIHHSGHYLWHENAPNHELYDCPVFSKAPAIEPALKGIYHEVDRQIGAIVTAAGADTVMVFSLHGMQASHGIPSFLGPLLCEKGFALLAGWSNQTWPQRASALLGRLKRQTPARLKKLYYQTLPPVATHRLARPTMMPVYDWSRTRAFSLPTDQHGWIRINLLGREAQGIVPLNEYESTCEELERLLRSLMTTDGRTLVHDVLRTVVAAADAQSLSLPDLVVHWENVAFESPLEIKGSRVNTQPIGTKFTGQHSLDGFCIMSGVSEFQGTDCVRVSELGRAITRILVSDMLY